MPSVIKHYKDNMRISLQADSRCLSYCISGLFSFLGLTWWLASALGQTWWASFFFLTAASALLAFAFTAALLSALLVLLAASATFLASAWAVALILGAGFQFLAVVNDPDALAFNGGLPHFQGSLLSAGRARAAGRFGRLAGAGRR
jgi:hypothetical protein